MLILKQTSQSKNAVMLASTGHMFTPAVVSFDWQPHQNHVELGEEQIT